MAKVLAVNVNGDITFCTVDPENRGKGRCNHIAHQNPGESNQEFVERINNLRIELAKKEKEDFIPYEGTEIETKPYRMSEEEKADLFKIENRMQLDQNIEGGYIELNEPLWNDMDKNAFSDISMIHKNKINNVLHGEAYIITNSNEKRYPVGKVIPIDNIESILDSGVDIEVETGVEGMNKFAKDVYNWEATSDVYVLPYYMRIGAGDGIDSDITTAYKFLLRNHKNPDKQQLAYESLLNNDAMSKNQARYDRGYRRKSLASEFVGKGGVFRACLSGSSIPYSARSVVTPEVMPYGEIKIPPAMAVDIYKPTLIEQLASEGKTIEEIDAWMSEYRKPQTEIPTSLRDELEQRISNKRIIMNRQPSLHTSSLQSFIPRISPDSTTKVHPLYCESYGMDFDGDTVSLYAINQDSIIPTVDKTIGAHNYINTHKPRAMEKSAIMPSKDALWGLLNILEKRSK